MAAEARATITFVSVEHLDGPVDGSRQEETVFAIAVADSVTSIAKHATIILAALSMSA
jgi:hypothetical protein